MPKRKKIEKTSQLTLERLPQMMARTGLSRSGIYQRIAAGAFPKPIKLGDRVCAWVSTEVDSWINSLIADRDRKVSAAGLRP